MTYYEQTKEEVLSACQAEEAGLSDQEAARRLLQDGKNELKTGKRKSALVKFLLQFKDAMILVLIAAAIVSAAVAIYQKTYADLIDSGLILLIVVVNAVIGFVQENKAEAALDALKSMNKPTCKVLRGGETKRIGSEDLVKGDIVLLEAGDVVPADLRLLFSASLKIEEAALTGESVPSEKDADAVLSASAPIGDRKNMAYSSGVVSYGRGKGVVCATGMDTEVGKIAGMLASSDEGKTPLQKQIDKTAKVLSVLVLVIASVIFAVSFFRGTALVDAFMTAVAIAVAAIPEGLPAVVTIVLAAGVQLMSKRRAIIRNLPSVETLGACEEICSDKTGTLTLNRMTVKELYTPSDGVFKAENEKTEGADRLARAMALCNDTIATEAGLSGDPTETALVQYFLDRGGDFAALQAEYPRVDELPFDSERKRMTTVHERAGEKIAFVKGAPDLLLARCAYIWRDGEIKPFTEEELARAQKANEQMANAALRVLGAAARFDLPEERQETEEKLVFLGLAGMIDPPRPEVKKAVATCKRAGMKPVMITGDHLTTACAIARDIGILEEGDRAMTGAEIDGMTDEEFAAVAPSCAVFARVSPENKVRIVKAFQSQGKVVAMTGDGVNDAPSIKQADIGVGMGVTGTDVSKGAADMILADDNFATIVGAVEEGRKIYANILKAVQFLLSANIAEVLCLFVATLFLLAEGQEFLTPVMILWINLVTDSFPALSLGMEKAESDVMARPPRKGKASLFAGRVGIDIVIQGLMQTALTLGAYCLGNYVLGDHAQGVTMAFVTLCLIQLFHAFNLRSREKSLFSSNPFANQWLNYSFLAGVALVLLVTLIPPVAAAFGCATLSIAEWGICLLCSVAIIPLAELQKGVERKISK